MAKFQSSKVISLPRQVAKLKRTYGNISNVIIGKGILSFDISIRPLETSATYLVRVEYHTNFMPKAYLMSPCLAKYNGKYPHHVYDTKKGYSRLCFYNPKVNEWDNSMYLADTVVPWLTSWLFAYEFWQITGQWHYDEAPIKKK